MFIQFTFELVRTRALYMFCFYEMSQENCYVSSSCNLTPQAAHWGRNKLICYSSCNAVLIYDPNIGGGKVIKTLTKHTKHVNAVRWITGSNYETEIVSCSADGTVIVWTNDNVKYVPTVLLGHTGTVNVVDALYKDAETKHTIVVSAAVDSTVRIWFRENLNENFTLSQVLYFGHGLCLTVKLSILHCKTLLLACAMDNSKIDLYVDCSEKNINFEKSGCVEGHSDWVRGIDFRREGNKILLASAAQDNFIRINEIIIATESKARYDLKTTKCNYELILQSILMGHEGWVYSVNWADEDLKLLSASIDKTLIIWEYDNIANLWLECTRLGEVGGNTLGFYGAVFSSDEKSLLAHSYHGAFHIWNLVSGLNIWDSTVTVGGHYDEVVDLSWEPRGEFLITASADQTTRIHGPWKAAQDVVTWHEIARPQVHGYDISCLTSLSRYRYASGAEEKIIRVFQAPANYVENFKRICFIEDDTDDTEVLPKGASVPSLGLSNKAVYEESNEEDAQTKNYKNPYPEESYFAAVDLYNPPTEEILIQNTLWPEVQKLYGHGYEVYSLAATSDGRLLASSCKSTSVEHAAILLWDTTSWHQIQKLVSHSLTIVQMAFSPDNNNLLSVSRDRRWSLFTRTTENKFELAATTDKKTGIHFRIIWCCAWSHDSKYFATGSRDGKVVVWRKNEERTVETVLGKYESASKCLDLKESVTALAFASTTIKDSYIVAIGVESGFIHIYKWRDEWEKLLLLDNSVAHHLTVKRLAFRPVLGRAGHQFEVNVIQLASCSTDHSVRVYDLDTTAF